MNVHREARKTSMKPTSYHRKRILVKYITMAHNYKYRTLHYNPSTIAVAIFLLLLIQILAYANDFVNGFVQLGIRWNINPSTQQSCSFSTTFSHNPTCTVARRRLQNAIVFSSSLHSTNDNNDNKIEEWSDFDDFIGSENIDNTKNNSNFEKYYDFTKIFQEKSGSADLTACQTRQFSLGKDFTITNYVGNMGFDEVTDWEYYYAAEDGDTTDRQVVQPNPFDSSTPRRTRTSSGSVVRIFRGEFVGQLGGSLSAQGLDRRILVKEFTGTLALALANSELKSIGKLQSDRVTATNTNDDIKNGGWIKTAAARSVNLRQDNMNVLSLLKTIGKLPFLGILGEANLAEFDGTFVPNDFYRVLGVPPPKPGGVWIIYEYAGLSTLQSYSVPAELRRAAIPPQRNFFGYIKEPPPLPPWNERANFVVKGVIKQAVEAVATMHESGIVHRSIGRTSIIISSKSIDKRDAPSPFNTMISQLKIKLTDFGFSGLYELSTMDEEFCVRARSFGLSFRKGESNVLTANFAIAEDMQALGFVVLGLLLTSLADVPSKDYKMPETDDDTLQRLLGVIFEKDMDQFREYVEAEDIWSKLVDLLDSNDRAGWKVLETLLLAREKVAKTKGTGQIFTVRGLLANPFFNS